MKRFNSLSIREKLIRVIVMTAAAVLLPSAAFLIVFDFLLLRHVASRNLGILAETIAYSSSAALAFEDPDDGTRILESFRADPDITEAVLYDMQGRIFATYPENIKTVRPIPPMRVREPHLQDRTLRYLIPVRKGETDLGWLFINYNLQSLHATLALHLIVTSILTLIALSLAYFLSILFQSRISKPILALEEVARKVSQKHDYNLRAVKITEDEIGSLTLAFNNMLEQIASKEMALRISEERLRIAVEASNLGVWDWDLNSGMTKWLGPIYQSIGLEPQLMEQAATPFMDTIHHEDRVRVERAIASARSHAGGFEADFRLQKPGGETLYIRSRGRTFLDKEGAPARMVGVLIDVSDLHLAEAEIRDLNRTLEERVIQRTAELRRALNEIEAFNYSVSHDLRTPLRGINGFSLALLDDYHDQLDDTGKDYLRRIVASCKRMSQLIDDLLELSRVTRQEMHRKKVNISHLAAESIRSLKAADPQRQVHVDITDNLETVGDPGLLGIVLDNILQNAWKFTSRKKNARIEIASTIKDGETVFFVRDNGAGFNMSFSDKLFGVFHRLHKSNEFEGTGIGLATVRRIIERHGGTVWATGKLDQGATFYFTIGHSIHAHESKPDTSR